MTSRRRVWSVIAACAAAGCGLSVVGIGEQEQPHSASGDAGPATTAETGSATDGATPSENDAQVDASMFVPVTTRDDAGCPTGRGPAMLRLFGSATSPALCIDQTEVSARQYARFVDAFATGRTPPQSGPCATNDSVVPLDAPALDTDDPVDRIDQCDAQLYCVWAGKHLCGRRDGTDALIGAGDANDAKVGEWFAACSQDGASTSVPATCNLATNDISGRNADDQVPVTADPPGGPTYAGHLLAHIVGNVEEWADGCDGDTCVARGASVKTTGTTDCTSRKTHPRMDRQPDLGFRCCAKP